MTIQKVGRSREWELETLHDVREFFKRVKIAGGEHNTIHLGVFVEPYLGWILDGRKTMESRFSNRRMAPYETIQAGDWIALKQASGPLVGVCRVEETQFFELDPVQIAEIRSKYSVELCAQDPEFWRLRRHSRYLTLMRIGKVHEMPLMPCCKKDRRGWVVLAA